MGKLKKGDLLIIVFVLLLAGGIHSLKWIRGGNAVYEQGQLTAIITVNGKEYETVQLTKKERMIDIQTEYGHNILKVYDYGIQMIYSDAPQSIALDMGFISKPYQQIICLPTRVMVEVLKPQVTGEEELDAVI
ncbi:NusG domain II-containing protein [Paenibacillus donghaensis]|uniref:Uncharacterized protein n=1 Tax=Paenibacillus donghaensis TaxID=414771 RepID=A0A2Z2KED0_9BACL|nr:NusG domain II-containing protein [Paenibacillus donghaensis]ASA21480.1 hypothetical protein B9T62_12240 [Paenibacillus donghaensis]